jgi:alpha-beta hydrolase superfamily lysophospholipase
MREWTVPNSRGTIIIVHGLGEHSGRYRQVAAALNADGWSVIGYDQTGHGMGGGKRGAIPSRKALLDKLAAVVDGAPTRRVILLGHSMGGVVAARFVAGNIRPVDALILSSPALDPGLKRMQQIAVRVLDRIVPNFQTRNGLDATKVSHDPEVVRNYKNDPLNHDQVTPRLVKFIMDEGLYVRNRAPQWRVPTLLMWAGDDHLVSPGGSAEFAAKAPRDVVTAHEFPGLYHEIFNESEPARSEVLAMMIAWLDALPAPVRTLPEGLEALPVSAPAEVE